ncbi:MAG: M14 family metallopeptidase [Candidatus Eisenbacteria bacterium]
MDLRPSEYSWGEARDARSRRLLTSSGEVIELGVSREGRSLLGYRHRVPGSASGPERSILLLSLLHPMEWIGYELHLSLLEHWLAGAVLPPGTTLLSLPVANPDGVAQVESALAEGQPRWVRGNAARVDLNRNFPVDHRPRSPQFEWWPLYRSGPAAWSEPESRALRQLVDGQHGAKQIALSLSLHSFGRWFFYPPSGRWARGRSTEAHHDAIEAALRDTRGRRVVPYSHAQLGSWSPLFRAYGTEIDYLEQATDGLAYLVEISTGGFLRWGLRRALHPFFAFNPRDPRRECERLIPLLSRLALRALSR